MKMKDETYLGDGLYAKYDGFAVWLRAPRSNSDDTVGGLIVDHVVALEPQTMHNFLEFVMTIKRHASIAHQVVREKLINE